jgi:uncharacterized protein YuzE
MPKLTYSVRHDAAFLKMGDKPHTGGRSVSCFWDDERVPGHLEVVLDEDGYIVGIELLRASERLRPEDLAESERRDEP